MSHGGGFSGVCHGCFTLETGLKPVAKEMAAGFEVGAESGMSYGLSDRVGGCGFEIFTF
jgi:hypothetical protein